MSNYYVKREAKVRIAEELTKRGWKIFGFKDDESDLMTDFYSPAYWDGIATKNGYTLVIDTKGSNTSGERKKVRWNPNYITINNKDQKRIENLKDVTVLRGATPGEEENAKNMITKIQSKYNNEGVSQYETIELYPSYMGNSKGCIWHIEKDGSLIDRGNKLTIFSKVPESYIYDIIKMKYKESYKFYNSWEYNEETGYNEEVRKERKLSEEEEKAIKEFKAFILRLERAVTGMNSCGDGTKETEEEGLKQQNKKSFKKVTKEVKKIVIEMQEVDKKTELKINDIFFQNGKGYLKVKEAKENSYQVVKLGSKNRGYQESKSYNNVWFFNKKSIDRAIQSENYTLKIYNLIEVEKIEIVEKLVRVKNSEKKVNKEDNKINHKKEYKNIDDDNISITYNEEKKGIEIKFNEKPEKVILNQLKENGFKWHNVKKVWYAKDTEERRNFINSLIGVKDQEELKEDKIEPFTVEEIEETNKIINMIIEMDWELLSVEANKEDNCIYGSVKKSNGEVVKEGLYAPSDDLHELNGVFRCLKSKIVNETLIDNMEVVEELSTLKEDHEENYINENLYNDSSKIESGFIFDCHFKEWDLSIEEIKEKLESFNIDKYYIGVNKFIFNNLSYDEIITIKAINDINKSILFIDKKELIKEDQEENNIIDLEEKKEEVKEMENNFNFDDILNKFDNVEIKNENRLKDEDLKVMEELQNNFDNMREKFKLYLELYKENKIYNVEGKEITRSIYTIEEDFIKEVVFKECNSFVSKIYYYFINKYNVTLKLIEHSTDYYLESRPEQGKNNLNWFMNELNYNLLLDDIFNQLGGFDFESKEIEEAKEAVIKKTKGWKESYLSVKGKNLSIQNFIYYSCWSGYKIDYNNTNSLKPLLTLIEKFNNTSKDTIDILLNNLKNYDDVTGKEFEIIGTKITGIKFFKNGKVQLIFNNGSNALNFAQTYLNYSIAA